MSQATPFQALKGERDNEPLIDENGNFILPEFQRSAPNPPIPAPPVPAIVHLCPGVECCDPSPFAYSIRRTPPSLTVDGTAGGDPLCSTCLNESYSATITATGIGPGLTWTIDSGFLPPGLTFHGGYNEDGEVLIDGSPTSGGNYSITVKATSPTGAFVTTTFPFNVFGITTSSIPDYTVGEYYSFQLTASGGSGNYGWSIDSGELPDGLSLDPISGVISGTPTGLDNGSQPIVFKVADLTCEQFSPVFTPHVDLVTSSNTSIATLYGWDEYPGYVSSPPKKYHTLTWSGSAEQIGQWHNNEGTDPLWLEYCFVNGIPPDTDPTMSDVRFEYSGSATIDTNGNQISNYVKNLFTPCVPQPLVPRIDPESVGFETTITSLMGYGWFLDPGSCPSPSYPPVFNADVSRNNPLDLPGLFADRVDGVFTATSFDQVFVAGGFAAAVVEGPGPSTANNVPVTELNLRNLPWFNYGVNYDIHAVLTDEYTDAEALSHATHIISNGRKAENFPRTAGFVIRNTTVNFDLDASNLTVGAAYTITVTFLDSDFSRTTRTYQFIATDTTHTINDQIPTPADGHSITILQPTIAFS